MMKKLALAVVMIISACSSETTPSPQALAPANKISNMSNVVSQEKRYIIAKYEVERNTKKRWDGFRTLMDMAVGGYAPAKDYYLSIRETKPVLPGESNASFAVYADAVKNILSLAAVKIEKETGQPCDKAGAFALMNTTQTAEEGTEQWLFDYCEQKVLVTVNMKLNQETGGTDWEVPIAGITLQ